MVFLLKPNYRNVKYAKVNQTIFSQNHIFLMIFSRFVLERNYVQGGVRRAWLKSRVQIEPKSRSGSRETARPASRPRLTRPRSTIQHFNIERCTKKNYKPQIEI